MLEPAVHTHGDRRGAPSRRLARSLTPQAAGAADRRSQTPRARAVGRGDDTAAWSASVQSP